MIISRSTGSEDSGVCSPCSYTSSPSRPRYCNPQLSYMDRVVMEVLETEAVYVNDLKQVIHGYLEQLSNSEDSPVSEDQLEDLFGNLRQIYSFNSTFLKELQECGLDPVRIARVFVKNNSGFSVYTDYCTNYPRAVEVLTRLMCQERVVQVFRQRQAALEHTLPLGSYLLKPNMVKNCIGDSEGYGDIVDALSTMTGIAHHINDMKRKHEHAVRVQEIQSLLLGWQGEDLTRYGELCAEGTFRMSGAKALRHAFLFDNMLLITKKKEEGILQYKAHIMCSNLMLIESIPGEPFCFHVIPFNNPRHQHTLQKREWTLQLKRVILENYNAVIPSHARQLVMELGQNRTDDVPSLEKNTPKRIHSIPEYLERRKQERRKNSEQPFGSHLFRGQVRQRRENKTQSEGSQIATTENKVDTGGSEAEEVCYPAENQSQVEHTEPDPGGCTETQTENDQPKEERKKSLEEIVSQLLMQNKEFQRVLQKQRHITSRRARVETSDEEDEGLSRSSGSLQRVEGDYDNLWQLKRTRSFVNQPQSSPELSLSGSQISVDGPTSPAVWLKQQRQHLASTPTSTKAGSLPRGFQLGTPDWHKARISPDRPFTIASDKAQELNLEDMERYVESQHSIARHRFPLPDDTEDDSTPDTSTHDLLHPEHKIYKTSLTKATIKQVISTVSNKLASLRLSSETLDQIETEHRASKIRQAFTKTFRQKKQEERGLPTYKQGSSALGARIAHGSETSDYADPRTLFPNITSSKKAASLLGIRPYSVFSLASELETPKSASNKQNEEESNCSRLKQDETVESDGSADSYYERSFEAIESTMLGDVCRDSAIFSDPEEVLEQYIPKSLSNKKIPPPVPDKPPNLRASYFQMSCTKSLPQISSTRESDVESKLDDDYDSCSIASTVIENTSLSKGWVRHVICKIQGEQSSF
ncbi:unnamed protein product [Nezara viridula]|uniref:DH domain-containing protein n=1 Tax=Nezara viridula TaxID=85310 RepID=A0A9P0E5J4_NEZVI|nr:unnamed protein product [Nezara viridula]